MMRILTPFLLFVIGWNISWAQNDDLIYDDKIYLDNIRSVKFHVSGLFTSYPIIELGDSGELTLSFDDISGGSKFYSYTFVHCDQNWNPTPELDLQEYLDGYEEDDIRDYEYSVGTFVDYTHYELRLPNDNMRWTKSGNYLLIIYDDENERQLAITRRFMVVESMMKVLPEMVRPADVSKLKTHHEFDFKIDPLDTRVANPAQELSVVVMQNGRWDTAIKGLKHKFILGQYLEYDYQDKIVFPAGKEFRHTDITSVRFRGEDILSIQRYADMISVVKEKEEPRTYKNFHTEGDLNGKFVIRTDDDDDHDLESEYAEVVFSLITNEEVGKDVYIFGALTDWKMDPKYRMFYDERVGGYIHKVLLKQGFYDYLYVISGMDGKANEAYYEGDWYEAFNDYTILVYFRPFGERYDKLVAAHTFVSQN